MLDSGYGERTPQIFSKQAKRALKRKRSWADQDWERQAGSIGLPFNCY
jgi:hypothetical protein